MEFDESEDIGPGIGEIDMRRIDVYTADELKGVSSILATSVVQPCVHPKDANMARHINIENRCDKKVQVTIKWTGRGWTKTLSYRLEREYGRLIRAHGLGGEIVSETDWDFSYGDDRTINFRPTHLPYQGGTNYRFYNASDQWLCFHVDLIEKGSRLYGSVTGMAEPKKVSPVFWSHDDDGIVAELMSARADPL